MPMMKLDLPSQDVRNDYKDKFLMGLVKRVQKGKLSKKAKKVLLPDWDTDSPNTSILEDLLILEPEPLKNLNDRLMDKITKGCIFKKRKIKQLNKIFDYEGVFAFNKSHSYWLATKIGRNTCTYCNRQYTFTVVKKDEKLKSKKVWGKNDNCRITRPAFDHWFAHKDYPLMSISLFNLIPSCSICNSSAKGMTAFSLETHIHPYVHEDGHPKLKFEASQTTEVQPKWTVKICTASDSKEERTVNDFGMADIYACHGELEVKDLMDFKEKYTEGYLKDLFVKVLNDSKGALTQKDVYRMLFGTEMDEDNYLDRPLSQMKHDLLKDMGVI